jgi:hypothetical protein
MKPHPINTVGLRNDLDAATTVSSEPWRLVRDEHSALPNGSTHDDVWLERR